MKKQLISICLSLSMLFVSAAPAFAGGALESFDITGNVPSPVPGSG